jgi:hypothetical protein
MSALAVTFTDLLLEVEQRCGLNSSATLGAVTSTPFIRQQLTRFLTNSLRTAWEMPEGKDWVWPFTVLNKTVTVSGGKIAWSDVDYGVWLSLYSADPRPEGAVAGPVSWTADQDGIWPAEVPASLFAFYVPRAPEFTLTPVVRATAYAVDDLVYDGVDDIAVDATPATGQCYRCLVAASTGAQLYDASKWQPQSISKSFQSFLAQDAQATWLRSRGNYDVANDMEAQGRDDLSRKFAGIYPHSPTGSAPAWVQSGRWR